MPSVNSLKLAITDLSTELEFITTCDFPESGVVQIENELISYDFASDVKLLRLTRGYAQTTAAPHLAGSEVTFVRSFPSSATTYSAMPLTDPTGIGSSDVEHYNYFLITTTTAIDLTLPAPTDPSKERTITVLHNDTSTGTLVVNTKSLDVGTTASFAWDKTAWLPVMVPVVVLPTDPSYDSVTLNTGTVLTAPDPGCFKVSESGGWAVLENLTGDGTEFDFSSSLNNADFYIYAPGENAPTDPVTFWATGARPIQFQTNGLTVLTVQPGLLPGALSSGYIDANSRIIHNVTDPLTAQDAATKNYVDNNAGVPDYSVTPIKISTNPTDDFLFPHYVKCTNVYSHGGLNCGGDSLNPSGWTHGSLNVKNRYNYRTLSAAANSLSIGDRTNNPSSIHLEMAGSGKLNFQGTDFKYAVSLVEDQNPKLLIHHTSSSNHETPVLAFATTGYYTDPRGAAVGIENDNPTASLHVGSSTMPAAHTPVIKLEAPIDNAAYFAIIEPSSEFNIYKDVGATWIGGNSPLHFMTGTNWDSRVVIADDGKVGIGVDTPEELLHVAGNIKLTGDNPTFLYSTNDLNIVAQDAAWVTFTSYGIQMNTNYIKGLPSPDDDQDAATKKYVDDQLASGASGSFTTSDSKTVTVTNGIITSIV